MSRREEVVLYRLNICHSCRPHQPRRTVCLCCLWQSPHCLNMSCCLVYSSIQRRSRLPARCLGMKKSLSEDCFSLSKDVIYQKYLDVYIFVVFLQLLKFSDRLGLFTAYSFNFHCFCCNTNVRLNLLWWIVFRFNNCFILLTSFRIENNSHLCGAIKTLKYVFAPKSEIFVVQL